ncbi:MAG: class I SAM-dependent methyltransferase [Bryobacteraceae bacterium]
MLSRRLFLTIPATAIAAAQNEDWDKWDVPYVPSPDAVIDAMLKLAKVTGSDTVYDLGCGDGRIVITAAKRYGARGVGIDIDPQRIKEANDNARRAGVADRVKFLEQDLFQADFSQATVVTLYLLTTVNARLKPKLLKELRPGTRIVSHQFAMGDWKPVRKTKRDNRPVYLWVVR